MLAGNRPRCEPSRRCFLIQEAWTEAGAIQSEHPAPNQAPHPQARAGAAGCRLVRQPGLGLGLLLDVLYDGRRFRAVNVIDEANREAQAIQMAQSLLASMLIRALDRLVDWYGPPLSVRMDNGPEMTSHDFVEWAQRKGIALNYIEPGEPNQNAYIKRFNRTFRTEVLDAYLFNSIEQVQAIAEDWLTQYNCTDRMTRWAACRPGSSCPD